MYASFKSIGAYVPPYILANSELEKMVDTTDEWILKRTGIKSRHIAKDENTSDMALKACKIAIERAKIDKSEIELLICATITPDYFCMPSTACLIAKELGLGNTPAFDISSACSGFIYLLKIAKSFIESGTYKNILIVGTEKMSAVVDWSDRGTCVLFGDGAGAALISVTDDKKKSIPDVHIASDGNYWDFLITPRGTSNASPKYLQMKGNETFKLAVRTLANDCEEILRDNNIKPEEIKYFIPHQANLRIIKAVGEQISLNDDQIVITVDKYGNTSAASIPMAINDLYEAGKLKNGDLMLLDAFGGGLTWGSALVYFDGN